jgi:hypothetical protein
MGKKKRIRNQKRAVISLEQPTIYRMESEASSPRDERGAAALANELGSLADLPELDDALSTDEYSSECLSTGDASLAGTEMELDEEMMQMEMVEEDIEEEDDMAAMSLHTPSHYPMSTHHIIRPFEDDATV